MYLGCFAGVRLLDEVPHHLLVLGKFTRAEVFFIVHVQFCSSLLHFLHHQISLGEEFLTAMKEGWKKFKGG